MVFPELCNCEQKGKGKWFPLFVSGELCFASHAEIAVLFCFKYHWNKQYFTVHVGKYMKFFFCLLWVFYPPSN